MAKLLIKVDCDGEFCGDCELHFMKPRRCMGFGKPLEVAIEKSRGFQVSRLPECLAAEKEAEMLEEVVARGRDCGNCNYFKNDMCSKSAYLWYRQMGIKPNDCGSWEIRNEH